MGWAAHPERNALKVQGDVDAGCTVTHFIDEDCQLRADATPRSE
jgi:hypothetical protein